MLCGLPSCCVAEVCKYVEIEFGFAGVLNGRPKCAFGGFFSCPHNIIAYNKSRALLKNWASLSVKDAQDKSTVFAGPRFCQGSQSVGRSPFSHFPFPLSLSYIKTHQLAVVFSRPRANKIRLSQNDQQC